MPEKGFNERSSACQIRNNRPWARAGSSLRKKKRCVVNGCCVFIQQFGERQEHWRQRSSRRTQRGNTHTTTFQSQTHALLMSTHTTMQKSYIQNKCCCYEPSASFTHAPLPKSIVANGWSSDWRGQGLLGHSSPWVTETGGANPSGLMILDDYTTLP